MSLTGYHNHKNCVNVGAPTFLALALILFAAAPLPGADSAPVLQADKAFVQALVQKDAAATANFLSPDFTWIDSVGKRFSRVQVLASSPAVANADVEAEVRVYGETAVVRANRGRMNVLRVWVKRAEGWRLQLYQEVLQVEKSEPPAARTSAECVNPCKTIPFEPQTANEKAAIASWQGVMRAMAESDADAYSPLIADEFTATDTFHDRPFTKTDRLAQINKQKTTGVRAAPQELVAAEMFDFGETVMMIAKEQRPGGKFYFNTRMWVKRDARWQMLFSLNTQIE
ncbi:MAG TPA: nuclear transport factor 2 family protein [Candidatus Baltobacteraceae bacterium]|nr:nuclear transport factor 2 family protein [Candidatus Baltobacteraceae bacterium]